MATKEEYKSYKKIGMCPICASNKAEEGKVICKKCSDRQKEKYTLIMQYKKQNGICTHCSNKAIEGRSMCASCAEKQRISQKKIYEKNKANKICIRCAKEEAYGDTKYCIECLYYERTRIEQYRKNLDEESFENRRKNDCESHKRLNAYRLDNSLCTKCGSKLPDSKYKKCEKCRIKANEYMKIRRLKARNYTDVRQYRKENNLCFICGEPNEEGYKTCIVCHDRLAKNARENANIRASRDKQKAIDHIRYINYIGGKNVNKN